MENIAAFKSDRLLQIYSRLVNGEILSKQGLAQEFGVTERSIQRDIGSLRCFITEQGLSQEILYNRNGKGYFLKDQKQKTLTNSEILAVCKILLESRSMNREEMIPILDKLLDCCVPSESKKAVSKLIANERHHYIPPQHGRNILPGLWEIGQAIGQHRVMEMEYRGLNGKLSVRTLEPVGLMFSEYYFYLVGFLRDIDRKAHFENPDDLFPPSTALTASNVSR